MSMSVENANRWWSSRSPLSATSQTSGQTSRWSRRRQRMPVRRVLRGRLEATVSRLAPARDLGKSKSAPMWRASSCTIVRDQAQSLRRRAGPRETRSQSMLARKRGAGGRANSGPQVAGPCPARLPGGSRSGRRSRSALRTSSTGPPKAARGGRGAWWGACWSGSQTRRSGRRWRDCWAARTSSSAPCGGAT